MGSEVKPQPKSNLVHFSLKILHLAVTNFPQTQLIKYGAAIAFAFKEELNELVIFRRCCSAANLWVLTLSHLSTIEGAAILHKPHGSNIGGSSP